MALESSVLSAVALEVNALSPDDFSKGQLVEIKNGVGLRWDSTTDQ